MRKQGNGTIVNIGSIGRITGWRPFATVYHASKFAIEGFTESLRQELTDFKINIIHSSSRYIRLLRFEISQE